MATNGRNGNGAKPKASSNGGSSNGHKKKKPGSRIGQPTKCPGDHQRRSIPTVCDDCGQRLCGARRKTCSIGGGGCGHRYPAAEYELDQCPDCGRIRFCGSNVTYANGRCAVHGGPTPSGPVHHNWVSGKFSKGWARMGLGVEFEELSHSDLMDAEIGLANLQMLQLVVFEQGVPTTKTLTRIQLAYDLLYKAVRAGADPKEQTRLVMELGRSIVEGTNEAERREEFVKLEAQLDKKRESIERRAINSGIMVNTDYVRGLAIRLIAANQTVIKEMFRELALPPHQAEDLIRRIGQEFNRESSGTLLLQSGVGSAIEADEDA